MIRVANQICCNCGVKKKCQERKDVIGGDDWNWWCDDCFNTVMIAKYNPKGVE